MPKIRGVKPDLWTDENFVELSPFARLLWIGLWNFACDNGHVQDKSKQIKMRVLPTDDINCAELLREIEGQGLIERAGGWITIPNLSHHQKPHKRWWATCDAPGCVLPEGTSHAPSNRGTTVAPPKRNRGNTVEQPESNGVATADGDGDGDGDGDVKVIASAADAADAPKSLALVPAAERPDVDRICSHLADRIEGNGSNRPTIGAGWRDAARLMLDRDKRTEDDVHAAIDWCQDDEFWRSNILSLPKLREKYETLRLQAQRSNTNRPRKGDIDWDAAMERARQMDSGGGA